MPMLDGDGQAVDKNGARRASATKHVHADPDRNPGAPTAAGQVGQALLGVMAEFVDHQQGSLKITRSQTGADLHLIWTWTAGPFRGHYVYVAAPYWHLVSGLESLHLKVLEVEAEKLKPTRDRMLSPQ